MIVWRIVEAILSAGIAVGTVSLAWLAYAQIRQGAAERSADAIAVRYLLFSELTRLLRPYKRVSEGWIGEGYFSYSASSVFDRTSDALRQGLAQIRLLGQDEQRAIGAFAESLALMQRSAGENRFESTEKPALARFVAETVTTLRLIERRLPQYQVA